MSVSPTELLDIHRRAVQRKGEFNETTAGLLGFAAALCEEIERLRAKVERLENQKPPPLSDDGF